MSERVRKGGDVAANWEYRKVHGVAAFWVDLTSGAVSSVDPKHQHGQSSTVGHSSEKANKDVDDLVRLPQDQLNPSGITSQLSRRSAADEIYTWVGSAHTVLVAVNPFKTLGIYTPSHAWRFLAPDDSFGKAIGNTGQIAPHTFAVAAKSFRDLHHADQALLISGDSGSGKTETTKHCLTLLAEAAGDSVGALEQKVLGANPVLEAYGNAVTVRNNNSSRFGKWIKLFFSREGSLAGAKIETYLLEKSRVTSLGAGERNYHIFHQLAGNRDQLPAELELADPGQFRYLRAGEALGSVAADARSFLEVQHSLAQLGFDPLETQMLWCITAATMHLGNITFGTRDDGGESCVIAGPLAVASRLLGVNTESLEEALTCRAIEVRGEVTISPLSPEDAKANTDALAKTLHARIFAWLVEKINECLNSGEEAEDARFIGVLDIFGFEIFEMNSFEQLCINFANETLQALFNDSTFKEEQGLYKKEQIPFIASEYVDNAEVLALLEGSTTVSASGKNALGLLPLLDDICRVPNGSEQKFMDKCVASFKPFKCWIPPAKNNSQTFTIAHYAGDVSYSVDGLLAKNVDREMFAHLRLLKSSRCKLCQELVLSGGQKNRSQSQPGTAKSLTTASADLRRQLNRLTTTVRACDINFVRCIKPNAEKVPRKFNFESCEQQLRYGGVFETVNIRKRGLPFRMEHAKFIRCYATISLAHPVRPLATKSAPWANKRGKDAVKAILEYADAHLDAHAAATDDPLAAAMGITLVFYRAQVSATLEILRSLAVDYVSLRISRSMRRYLGRKFRRVAFTAIQALESVLTASVPELSAAENAIVASNEHILQLFRFVPKRLPEVVTLRNDLQARHDVTMRMHKLVRDFQKVTDTGIIVKALMASLGEAMELTIRAVPYTPDQLRIEEEAKQLARVHGAAILEQQIERALKLPVKSVLQQLARSAQAIEYASQALDEMHRVFNLPDMEFTELQLKRAEEAGETAVANDLHIQLVKIKVEMCPDNFIFERFPTLRDPILWFKTWNVPSVRTTLFGVKDQVMNHDKHLESMARWQSFPIHASLVVKTTVYAWRSEPQTSDVKQFRDHDARVMFRNVMGYMGDRRHPYPDTLAVELVNCAVASLPLTSEIFAQILKQLTANPGATSTERGWQLLSLLLDHAAPASNIEVDFLAGFIWSNAPAAIRLQLLDRLFQQQHMRSRNTELLELPEIPGRVKQLWSKGGRPSLQLPRASLQLPWVLDG